MGGNYSLCIFLSASALLKLYCDGKGVGDSDVQDFGFTSSMAMHRDKSISNIYISVNIINMVHDVIVICCIMHIMFLFIAVVFPDLQQLRKVWEAGHISHVINATVQVS